MQDAYLVRRCQTGDINAFEELVNQYSEKAVRTAYLVTGRRDLAEDMAQEAFVQCYYSLKNLKKPELFKSWFYQILLRTSWKMARQSQGRLIGIDLDDQECANLMADHDLAQEVEARQTLAAINEAINQLSSPLKAVVVLRFYSGLTVREIADATGCREGTVKSRLYNARRQMAENLRQQGWELKINEAQETNLKECGLHAGTSPV